MASDASGDLIVTGETDGVIEGSNAGGFDYVRKFDGDGNALWTRQFGSSANDIPHGVASDESGTVIVVGDTGGDLEGSSAGLARRVRAGVRTLADAEGTVAVPLAATVRPRRSERERAPFVTARTSE